ncbi:MAG: response regulator [Legionellaceae bacterium]|nr:response regulator [Legionellaceae bacterium]
MTMEIDPKLYRLLFETFKGELTEQHQVMVDALIGLEKSKSKKKSQELLELLFRTSHNLKGAAKSVSIDAIATVAHGLEDVFSEWRENQTTPSKRQINDCLQQADTMLDILTQSEAEIAASASAPDEMIRVPLRRVERINAKLNELVIFQLRLSNWSRTVAELLRTVGRLEGLDAVKKQLTCLFEASEKLTGEFSRELFTLQQEGRSMRLLPMSHVFSPLKRVVREVAEGVKKSVELKVEGGEVEIDKSILDALKTPLQHLVRNAISHGIELPDVREKQGKAAVATIRIQAVNEVGQIKLIFSDDGAGINAEKIKQRALEKQLYTKEALEKLSETDILSLIFHSGLSTADNVSELSGRGVGLDAVLSDIQAIKGNITIESVLGEGCTFTLTLPLTLTSSRGLFVRLKDKHFMLPTIALDALYDIKSSQLKRIDNRWAVVIHGKPISVASLSSVLGLGEAVLDGSNTFQGILVGDGVAQVLILVDEIIEEHDCVLKPLPKPLEKLNHLSGATLTESGELVLALNVETILEKIMTEQLGQVDVKGQALSSLTVKETPEKTCILVVDDALTTRTLAINALHAAGYETLDAEDGEKALELLQAHVVNCVVTDIEMPLMDGFELTAHIKENEKLAHIPVIIVSSRGAEEDKKQGLDAGASAYLVKKDFDTRKLIDMVEALL